MSRRRTTMSRTFHRPVTKRSLRESLYLFGAAATVMILAQTVYSQQNVTFDDAEERSFAGDRSPGILEEPSETPTGPNADLYAEVEREFEATQALRRLREPRN